MPATDLIDEADKNRFDMEIVARATKKGVTANTVGQTIKGMLPPDALAKIKAEGIYLQKFNRPGAWANIRFDSWFATT